VVKPVKPRRGGAATKPGKVAGAETPAPRADAPAPAPAPEPAPKPAAKPKPAEDFNP
jgi:2-oxoglutarate dehydrogenase E2 component (dihydrolipoamide succinyltransferase)